MKKLDMLIKLLKKVLGEIEKEEKNPTLWRGNQLKEVVKPEIDEILYYANKGEFFFKFGKKQKMLQSTYLMADTLERLDSTSLGKSIIELQELYNVV